MTSSSDQPTGDTPGNTPELSADDARIVDRMLQEGFEDSNLDDLSDADRRRGDRLLALLGTIDAYPVEPADDLLADATMLRIERHEAAQSDQMRLTQSAATGGGQRRIRMPDFIGIAAMILIALSVIWPIVHHARRQAVDEGCANGLRQVGEAFALYANDFGGDRPMITAGPSFGWSSADRHTDNLRPLVEQGYCDVGHLDCPGHADEKSAGDHLDCGYSYQWQAPGPHPALGSTKVRVILIGDLNPLVDAARAGGRSGPMTISISHRGRGQNILFDDGSVVWLRQPVLRSPGDGAGAVAGDNIWLPAGRRSLEPGAQPIDTADSFLVH